MSIGSSLYRMILWAKRTWNILKASIFRVQQRNILRYRVCCAFFRAGAQKNVLKNLENMCFWSFIAYREFLSGRRVLYIKMSSSQQRSQWSKLLVAASSAQGSQESHSRTVTGASAIDAMSIRTASVPGSWQWSVDPYDCRSIQKCGWDAQSGNRFWDHFRIGAFESQTWKIFGRIIYVLTCSLVEFNYIVTP